MEKISLEGWQEYILEDSKKILKVSNQINFVLKNIKEQKKINKNDDVILKNNFNEVLRYWTGLTDVGYQKKLPIEKAFQKFFDSVMELLLFCYNSKNAKMIKEVKPILYKGTLYRCLGYGEPVNTNKYIEPNCDNIWVSWSKNKNIDFILSDKLHGPITKIQCNTEDCYGIDLTALKCSKNNEEEVVFPTKKEIKLDIVKVPNE